MLPSLSLPPVVCCFGTNPIQAARLRPEGIPVADLCNQCGGADRADAWDLRQPAARLTRTVQGHDALVDGCYLGADSTILPRQHIENAADSRGEPGYPRHP
jgi:hypothetical protein